MESALLRRPILDLISTRSKCLFCLTSVTRRHESSYRRTKHRLNIKPDSSFLPSKNSPKQDHIIFNPPSSAPSVLHTPSIFLPKEDKRKQLLAARAAATPLSRLPPIIKRFRDMGVKHHLTEAEIAEITRLRTADPFSWTSVKLARKFNCSTFFVTMCCEATEEVKEIERQKIAARMAKWGSRKTRAYDDKLKRRELALSDA